MASDDIILNTKIVFFKKKKNNLYLKREQKMHIFRSYQI